MEESKIAKVAKKYSEAFKRQVVLEIERGIRTIPQAKKHYSIGGAATIRQWLERFSQSKRVCAKPVEGSDQEKQLELALAAACMKIVSLESIIECASEHYGADLKKSFVTRLCFTQGPNWNRKGGKSA